MIPAEKLAPILLAAAALFQSLGCVDDSRPPRPRVALGPPPERLQLHEIASLPDNASTQELTNNLPRILRAINRSSRSDLPYVYASFAVLGRQPKIVAAVGAYYRSLPKTQYADRLLSVKILGALRRPDALPVLRSVLLESTVTPSGTPKAAPDQQDDLELVIGKRAVRGIAHLQTAEADREVIRILSAHPSQAVKREALWAYLGNKRYSKEAVATVRRVLPADMVRWIPMQRFHRGMDPTAFDKEVRAWRAIWAVPLDPDSPLRTDTTPTPRAGAEARCNQDVLTSDTDVWAVAEQVDGFREWFRHEAVFNLPKDDWTAGWGYRQEEDPTVVFPFNKMLATGFLLTYGLERPVLPSMDAPSSLHYWVSQNVTERIDDELWNMFPTHAVLSGSDGVIHVFGKRVSSTGDELLHFSWHADGGWSVENVSRLAPIPGATSPLFWSGPAALLEDDGTLHVFVTLASNELTHYSQQAGAGWAAENVTRDRVGGSVPFVDVPTLVRAPFSEDGSMSTLEPTLHVFGLDRRTFTAAYPGRLVHYRLGADGTWRAGQGVPPSPLGITRVIDARKFWYDFLYVLAQNFGSGLTAYKWRPGGWVAEPLESVHTDFPEAFQFYGNYRVVGPGPGRQGIALWSRGYGPDATWTAELLFPEEQFWSVAGIETYDDETAYPRLHLFATNLEAELLHLWRSRESGAWHEENLTQLFGHHLWVPDQVMSGPDNTLHVFAQAGEFLIHYYWSEGRGWRGDNFGNRGRIHSAPRLVMRGTDEQHVIAVNDDWDLIHFSQLPEPQSAPWHPRDYYSFHTQGADLFKYVPRETVPEGVAASQVGAFVTNQVEMSCLSFENHDELVGVTGTANRAAVWVHEALHHRYGDPIFGTGANHAAAGDDWFAHGVYYPFPYGSEGIKTHSAIQLQVEYLSDIGEFPDYWVPFSVFGSACDEANQLIEAAIKSEQDPGWRCGDLRPFP
jgi:hypothetical protein